MIQDQFKAIRSKCWLEKLDHFNAAPPVPCMLTAEEQEMLTTVAALYASDGRAMCDLGSFAGGSAYCLANGIKNVQDRSAARVHAYDFFEMPEDRKYQMLYRHGFPAFSGTDYLPLVRKLLRDHQGFIEFHKGDVAKATWHGGAIAVIHVDVSKSYALNTHIIDAFFPHLVPNYSLLIQQDYQHWANPWVAASMELLSDYFELLSWTASNSVLFACKKAVPQGLGRAIETELRKPDAMITLLRSSAARFPCRSQKHAIAKAILAYRAAPATEKAWQFKLDLPADLDLLEAAGIPPG